MACSVWDFDKLFSALEQRRFLALSLRFNDNYFQLITIVSVYKMHTSESVSPLAGFLGDSMVHRYFSWNSVMCIIAFNVAS